MTLLLYYKLCLLQMHLTMQSSTKGRRLYRLAGFCFTVQMHFCGVTLLTSVDVTSESQRDLNAATNTESGEMEPNRDK